MKKSVKAIIGLSAAVAVLGGGLAALVLTDPNKDTEPSDSTVDVTSPNEKQEVVILRDENVTVTDPDTGELEGGVVKTVDIVNTEGELHVIQNGTVDGAVQYTLKGYDGIKQLTTVVGTLANNLVNLTSNDVIEENCTNLAKFGLDKPEATVEVTFETGSKYTLLLGNEAPSGSETYTMVKGRDTVYTVRNSAVLNYLKAPNEFINKTIVENPDEIPVINSIRIERKDMEEDLYIEKLPSDDSSFSGGTSASHIMKSPTEAYIDLQKADRVLSGMFGLYASDFYCINCTEADIAEAGLAEPFCTVTFDRGDDITNVLYLSEPFAGETGQECYAMTEGGKIIYIIGTETAPWATVQPVDIASTIFIASYVWSVQDLKVTAGSDSYSFKVSRVDPSKPQDEATRTEDYAATLNGKDIETERFRLLYSYLLSARAENFALGEKPSGALMAAVSYTDSYHKKDYNIEFYDHSNLKCLVVVNGESKFIVAKSYVQTLIENAARVDSEEDMVMTWK